MDHSYRALTPVTFLERAGRAFPERLAVIHAGGALGFGRLLSRARRLVQALRRIGVEHGDRVAVLSENSIHAVEAHFAVPGAGATLVMLNPWLSAAEARELLDFSEPKAIIADGRLFRELLADGAARACGAPHALLYDEASGTPRGETLDYESCLSAEDDSHVLEDGVQSELDPIAMNFTSGTTGKPKGVLYSHRAAYIHALGQALMMGLTKDSKYLWSLPMFHVNGWGHVWANVAVGSAQVVPATGFQERESEFADLLGRHGITHLAGAPRLIRLLTQTKGRDGLLRGLTTMTGGAAPPPSLIQRLEEAGAVLIHQYGLNETLGPFVVCEDQEEWCKLPAETRAKMRARQGVAAIHAGTGLRVVGSSGAEVPHDGRTLGEVVMAGNTVATQYFRNPAATAKAFRDGWFRSGDMAVMHPDGYLEIRDRIKDLIYVETEYGWENISSIEIENALVKHGAVRDAAVIGVSGGAAAKPSAPRLVAFLELHDGAEVSEAQLRAYCDETFLSAHKRPHAFYFTKLPKTSTGKVRKDLLSEDAMIRLGRAQENTAASRDGARETLNMETPR